MGILNRLFGSTRSLAGEIVSDEKKIMNIWGMHQKKYGKRDDLSKFFKFDRVDDALKDLDALSDNLEGIKNTISDELVDIRDEEMLEEDIVKDLRELASKQSKKHSCMLVDRILKEQITEGGVREILKKIYHIIKTILHAIWIIQKKIGSIKEIERRKGVSQKYVSEKDKIKSEIKDMLKDLFILICHHEPFLYQALTIKHLGKERFEKINMVVRAVLLNEKIEGEIHSTEERFVAAIVNIFAKKDKTSYYWKIADDIFDGIWEKAKVHLDCESDSAMRRIETFMSNDKIIYGIIKEKHPELPDSEITIIVKAFRKAYDGGHFEEIEGDMHKFTI